MTRLMTARSLGAAALLWSCVALFGLRVVAQFEALLIAPEWLPPMSAWYSGLLPYYLLLPAQIVILMALAVVAWNRRIRTGAFALASPRVAGALRIFAGLYFVVMAVRLGVNIVANGADFWSEGAIPVAFHWVLALFMLVAGRRHHAEEYEELPYGDVPAIPPVMLQGLTS